MSLHWVLAHPKPLKAYLFHPTHPSLALTILTPKLPKLVLATERCNSAKGHATRPDNSAVQNTHEGMPLPIFASQRVTDLVSQPQHAPHQLLLLLNEFLS